MGTVDRGIASLHMFMADSDFREGGRDGITSSIRAFRRGLANRLQATCQSCPTSADRIMPWLRLLLDSTTIDRSRVDISG